MIYKLAECNYMKYFMYRQENYRLITNNIEGKFQSIEPFPGYYKLLFLVSMGVILIYKIFCLINNNLEN